MKRQQPRGGLLASSFDQLQHSEYPHSLNMYKLPPQLELTLTQFELYALDRLYVLKAVETAHIRQQREEQQASYIDEVCKQHLPLSTNMAVSNVGLANDVYRNIMEERRKDHISHFILRLAYCRTEDLRQWFVRQEVQLFKHRINKEHKINFQRFVETSGLDLKPLSADEREAVVKSLGPGTEELRAQLSSASANFFMVPFETVPDLVARRQVLLHRGQAFIPDTEQRVLVVNAFRDELTKALEETARMLPMMEEDNRLIPILTSLARQHINSGYGSKRTHADGQVSHESIDSLAKHFPLCMQNLHYHLRSTNHLKHGGRMQYGLFLKGIGLSLEEALLFWRRAFNKISDDAFQKQYAYNIRHNYGAEGKRTNYDPYSCMKIITSNQPSTGDHHGCPFRHFSPDNLRANLLQQGLSEPAANEVLKIAKEGHYQIACTRLFEFTHGAAAKSGRAGSSEEAGATAPEIIETIEHPNQWFDMSTGGSSDTNDDKKRVKKEFGRAQAVER
ncbi:eukaryotic and archaeal DNA primase, large subunit-domain-containing protein [Polychytrium aggregatum]|uniref:eukaryotic and archaeal DNA primase, large subunit-domain-containing protein n=1 Tax=Polychytrium aggregatum TaxID=110093 RepID=UPI0022FF40FD|nr:eukaryotic and archaeal DNA primase, large subunit-domain-containing protein [Polychytrium aggregatum]KAI9203179.1 eukaryotic and archaeal DNA primase, large subunit-domain-containing protein [Polychytrium aggregatum]